MLSVLSITAPVFFVIGIGYICARYKIFPIEAQKIFGQYVFYCAMPCYLFMAMAKAPIHMVANIDYIISFALGLVVTSVLAWVVAYKCFKCDPSQSILAMMAGSYTNSAFVGIPIITMAFGESGPVVVVALFQIVIVTTFILTVLDSLANKEQFSWGLLKSIPRTVALNPIVGGSLLGILFSLIHVEIPDIVGNSLDLLGRAGIPTALFALGLSLGQVRQKLSQSSQNLILILVGLKNIIHPLVAWVIGFYIFDLPTMWLGALVVVSAMPTAMNNFIFAQKYNSFIPEASQVVFISSVVSLFTLSALLWLITIW